MPVSMCTHAVSLFPPLTYSVIMLSRVSVVPSVPCAGPTRAFHLRCRRLARTVTGPGPELDRSVEVKTVACAS